MRFVAGGLAGMALVSALSMLKAQGMIDIAFTILGVFVLAGSAAWLWDEKHG